MLKAGTPETIEHRQTELAAIHHKVFGEKTNGRHPALRCDLRGQIPEAVAGLAESDARVRELLDTPASTLGRYPSESEGDLALASRLVTAGIAPQAIDAALRWRRGKVGGKRKDGQYYLRTVERACRGYRRPTRLPCAPQSR